MEHSNAKRLRLLEDENEQPHFSGAAHHGNKFVLVRGQPLMTPNGVFNLRHLQLLLQHGRWPSALESHYLLGFGPQQFLLVQLQPLNCQNNA